jgi:hypothetical protein
MVPMPPGITFPIKLHSEATSNGSMVSELVIALALLLVALIRNIWYTCCCDLFHYFAGPALYIKEICCRRDTRILEFSGVNPLTQQKQQGGANETSALGKETEMKRMKKEIQMAEKKLAQRMEALLALD